MSVNVYRWSYMRESLDRFSYQVHLKNNTAAGLQTLALVTRRASIFKTHQCLNAVIMNRCHDKSICPCMLSGPKSHLITLLI